MYLRLESFYLIVTWIMLINYYFDVTLGEENPIDNKNKYGSLGYLYSQRLGGQRLGHFRG